MADIDFDEIGEEDLARGEPQRPVLDASFAVPVDRVKARLLPWIKDLVDNPEQEEPLTLTVSQVAPLQGEKPIRSLKYDFDQPPERCVDQIVMAALNDMEGGNFRTTVAYCVTVSNRIDRFNFTLTPARQAGGHTEEHRRDYFPDMRGLLAQMMAKDLDLTDRAIASANASTALLLKIIDKQEAEINLLKRGQYQRDKQIQDLMDTSLKRTMMYETHQAELANKERFAEGFKKMVPGLVASVAGPQWAAATAMMMQGADQGGVPGLNAGPTDEDIVDEFVLRLDRNQQLRDKLFELLMPDGESVQLLMELYRRSTTRRELRARQQAEAAAKQNGGGQNGGGNGNGGGGGYGNAA